jgi:hypothetical protein
MICTLGGMDGFRTSATTFNGQEGISMKLYDTTYEHFRKVFAYLAYPETKTAIWISNQELE